MLNAYPDSIGKRLADMVALLKRPELKDAFSLFYILPTFFNSDLDRGFSIIDYDINEELVSPRDLEELNGLNMVLKLDLVLNHLSVQSPQFQDLIRRGRESRYRDFFIDWNEFWDKQGSAKPNGEIIPDKEYLDKLFMRKPGLPILRDRPRYFLLRDVRIRRRRPKAEHPVESRRSPCRIRRRPHRASAAGSRARCEGMHARRPARHPARTSLPAWREGGCRDAARGKVIYPIDMPRMV